MNRLTNILSLNANCVAMEAETIQKNGVSPKDLITSKNYIEIGELLSQKYANR